MTKSKKPAQPKTPTQPQAAPAKAAKAPEDPRDRLFLDTGLALCVVEALVEHDLIETSIRIPELAPQDDDNPDDESESWRDRFDTNQTEPVDQLLALLEQHRDKLAMLREIGGMLFHLADDYEINLYSLAGIEACTRLERIKIWSTDPKLDLSPLASLPALKSVDLTCTRGIRNLEPLLQIASLKQVIGQLHEGVAEALRRRNVEVKQSAD
jgi:hypothetical protein